MLCRRRHHNPPDLRPTRKENMVEFFSQELLANIGITFGNSNIVRIEGVRN